MHLAQVVNTVSNSQTRRSLLGMLDTDNLSVVRWALRNGFTDVAAQNNTCDCGVVHEDWHALRGELTHADT